MGCAVHLYEFFKQAGVESPEDRMAVVTRGRRLGASRMSGSDKQTYYKMGTSPRVPDTAHDFAETLTAFGCCHGDLALVEGNCSLRQFYHLVAAGVPFPHDPEGAFLGYKTDHDPYERATSAGPKTSRFMAECLEAKVNEAGVPIYDQHEVLQLIRQDDRIVAMLTIDRARMDEETLGLTLFEAENFVLAAGGPGDLYESTVYPAGQVGLHGQAFAAGLAANNLTESQYGLASIKHRWNVSGTYMQALPRIYSTAVDGVSDEQDFLLDYFSAPSRMATCIFLKGYQWPFDAERIDDEQSSLIDMAVHRETIGRGRRVFMDFRRNPTGFDLGELDEEARLYLERTGATQTLPIERLAHMNQPAIDLYAEHRIDLHSEPLEIAVCAQHQNGGFVVDKWWQSTLKHTFVIGEMAGTHGVKRPGGTALNAGQTGALRTAEFIANVYDPALPEAVDVAAEVEATVQKLRCWQAGGGAKPADVLSAIRKRMTRYAAHIRDAQEISAAVASALRDWQALVTNGFAAPDTKVLCEAVNAESMALAHVAHLVAVEDLLLHGGGSRGSYIVLDTAGAPLPEVLRSASGDLPCRRPENASLQNTIQEIAYERGVDKLFTAKHIAVRPIPSRNLAFEPAWTAYREKKIFADGM